MAKEHHYAIELNWTGAARGPTTNYRAYSRDYEFSAEGKPQVRGSADASFLGDAASYNPEDLLVASLSACHMLTYLANCALAGIEVTAYEDRATGTMVQEGRGGRFREVVLRPRVTIARAGDREEALRLHEPASRECFIAQSVNFPVHHEPEILTA